MTQKKKTRTIHDDLLDKTELAAVYAEDGAFGSAARVLREAAAMLETRQREINAEMGVS